MKFFISITVVLFSSLAFATDYLDAMDEIVVLSDTTSTNVTTNLTQDQFEETSVACEIRHGKRKFDRIIESNDRFSIESHDIYTPDRLTKSQKESRAIRYIINSTRILSFLRNKPYPKSLMTLNYALEKNSNNNSSIKVNGPLPTDIYKINLMIKSQETGNKVELVCLGKILDYDSWLIAIDKSTWLRIDKKL